MSESSTSSQEKVTLQDLGWSSYFEEQKEKGIFEGVEDHLVRWSDHWVPARISADYGINYEVFSTEPLSERCSLAKKMRATRHDTLARPCVGDWVAVEEGDRIVGIFPRKTALVRKAAGELVKPQVLAANIDTIFIVTSMNREFNDKRLERYLTAVFESGAKPVILLNKSDLVEDPQPFVSAVKKLHPELDVVTMAAGQSDEGDRQALEKISQFRHHGETVALVGSSGVGKSTITNLVLGEELISTQEIRSSDDEGRHTTTHREMVVLPDGLGLIIDTPGMREFGLWMEDGTESLDMMFEEIVELSQLCRFRDCRHEHEPGCAILEAIEQGSVSKSKVARWKTLQDEASQSSRSRKRRKN